MRAGTATQCKMSRRSDCLDLSLPPNVIVQPEMMQKMNILRLLLAPMTWCAALLLHPVSGFATSITLSGSDDRVSIEANDAGSFEVLERLAADYDFTIERIGIPKPRTPMWHQFSGHLPSVIATTLANESYLIVYSSTASHGIEKVVVFGANCQVPASATPPQMSAPNLAVPPEPGSQSQPRAPTRSSALALSPRPLAKAIITPHPVATH